MKKLSKQPYSYICFEIARLRTRWTNDEEHREAIEKRYVEVTKEFNTRTDNWFWKPHAIEKSIKEKAEFQEHQGKWVTLRGGQKVFIREGESLQEATERLKPTKPSEGVKEVPKDTPKQLQPLAREALKYDTAEEFEEAMSSHYTDGGGDVSRDPTDVKEIREEMGTLAGYDERTKRDWFGRYTDYETPVPEEDEYITIYRATKGDNIRPGDYVTQSKAYAESHLESVLQGEGKIITVEATIKDLSAVNPNEFWYVPESMEKYDNIKDFWKDVHKET